MIPVIAEYMPNKKKEDNGNIGEDYSSTKKNKKKKEVGIDPTNK